MPKPKEINKPCFVCGKRFWSTPDSIAAAHDRDGKLVFVCPSCVDLVQIERVALGLPPHREWSTSPIELLGDNNNED